MILTKINTNDLALHLFLATFRGVPSAECGRESRGRSASERSARELWEGQSCDGIFFHGELTARVMVRGSIVRILINTIKRKTDTPTTQSQSDKKKARRMKSWRWRKGTESRRRGIEIAPASFGPTVIGSIT